MADRSENQELIYDKLKNSKFKQQKLPGWRPIPSMICNTVFLICFGLVFDAIGAAIVYFSKQIVEIRKEYYYENGTETTLEVKIKKKMNKPIMVYYNLDNFYQNHRRYMKSKSIDQLKGKNFTLKEMNKTKNCDPFVTNDQMEKEWAFENKTGKLEGNDLAIPCGLMAKSFFNDTFKFQKNDVDLEVNEKDIALEFDKKNYGIVDRNKQWIDMTDEHFIVWMRPAGLPNFTKLWGRINDDFEIGDTIIITVKNNYDALSYNSSKAIVLTTVNEFGGKNMFLGISYIVIGTICLILSVVFFIGFKIHKKKEK